MHHFPYFHGLATAMNLPLMRRLVGWILAGALITLSPIAGALDLNVANVQELQGLKGIGPRMAELIVRERERSGPYQSLQDLSDRVRGIGSKKVQRLAESGLVVGAVSSAKAESAVRGSATSAPASRATGR